LKRRKIKTRIAQKEIWNLRANNGKENSWNNFAIITVVGLNLLLGAEQICDELLVESFGETLSLIRSLPKVFH
jgi:hypothetical protein